MQIFIWEEMVFCTNFICYYSYKYYKKKSIFFEKFFLHISCLYSVYYDCFVYCY